MLGDLGGDSAAPVADQTAIHEKGSRHDMSHRSSSVADVAQRKIIVGTEDLVEMRRGPRGDQNGGIRCAEDLEPIPRLGFLRVEPLQFQICEAGDEALQVEECRLMIRHGDQEPLRGDFSGVAAA